MMTSSPKISSRDQVFGISKNKSRFFCGCKKWEAAAFVVCLIGLGLSWLIVILDFPYGSTNIVLHYNIPFGIDMIGVWWQIWLLPAIGTLAVLLNYFWLLAWLKKFTARAWHLVHYGSVFLSLGLVWVIWLLQYQQTLS